MARTKPLGVGVLADVLTQGAKQRYLRPIALPEPSWPIIIIISELQANQSVSEKVFRLELEPPPAASKHFQS
eukprot:scaffold176038_cov38-Tisochrysis_lutea.AAC.3